MKANGAFCSGNRVQRLWRRLALGLGLVVLLMGCKSTADKPPFSEEFLLVYSGDFRGFFEPCG